MSDPPRPRLLVVTSTFPRWRDDHEPPFVYELARRLDEFEVHVLAPHAPGAKSREVMDGIRVRRFPYAPERLERLAYDGGIPHHLRSNPLAALLVPGFLLALAWHTRRMLRELDPVAVHAHWLLPQGLVVLLARALSGRRPPVLVTAHGADVHGLRGKLATLLKRRVIMRADLLSTVSRDMAARIEGLARPRRPVAVVPMGIDTRARFTAPPTPAPLTRLVFAGRLVEKKGLPVLVAAFARLAADFPGLRLCIAGGGPLDAETRARVAQQGLSDRVDMPGPYTNSDLPAILRSAGIAVFPFVRGSDGDQEGLGLVLAEAMACGCVTVAGDVPGARDVITHGRDGLLVAPGDSAALATAIAGLLHDPGAARQLARSGLESARRHFDLESIGTRYADLLRGTGASG